MTIEKITNSIRNELDQYDIHYDYDPTDNFIRFSYRIKSKLKTVEIVIEIREDDFIIHTLSPINADEESINEVVRYCNLVNNARLMGCFSVNNKSGEIVWEHYIDCQNMSTIPQSIIHKALVISMLEYETFGDGLSALLMGFSDADTEFEKAIKKTE